LHFTVSVGKNRREVDHWLVRVRGVRDFLICDANGGGIQMSDVSHPAVRQFVEPTCVLHFAGLVNPAGEVVARLWESHLAAVDDWIPIDRYLPPFAKLRALLGQRTADHPINRIEELLPWNVDLLRTLEVSA
jgi:hypothetical protein